MTIFINGRFLTQKVTGVQRYARETLGELDKLLSADPSRAQLTVLVPPGTELPDFKTVKVVQIGRLTGHLWEQLELPWYCRGSLLYSFGPTGPLLKTRQVITIHDTAVFAVPDAFTPAFRRWYRFLYRRLTHNCAFTVTVSKFSKCEISRYLGVPADKIRVSTEGWQHILTPARTSSEVGEIIERSRPFVLAVSSPTPNKNFALVLRAADALREHDITFLVAGSSESRVFAGVAFRQTENFKMLGYVSDADLRKLMGEASCFVFPSKYEGFGIPPLEAMGCGCPVIASDIPATREICGTAPLYFEPDAALELASAIRSVVFNKQMQQQMRNAGMDQAAKYSWPQSAELNLTFMLEAARLC